MDRGGHIDCRRVVQGHVTDEGTQEEVPGIVSARAHAQQIVAAVAAHVRPLAEREEGERGDGVLGGLVGLIVAWRSDQGLPNSKEAAMAKLHASEAALTVCDKAARVLASYGYAMEYPIQRYLRDIRFTLIGGGTSEILKLIIAKEVGT